MSETGIDEMAIHERLSRQFAQASRGAPELSAGFEERVMRRVSRTSRQQPRQIAIYLFMCMYWVATVAVASWLLWGGEAALAAPGGKQVAVLLATLAVSLLLPLIHLRNSPVRLSQLFLKTLHQKIGGTQ